MGTGARGAHTARLTARRVSPCPVPRELRQRSPFSPTAVSRGAPTRTGSRVPAPRAPHSRLSTVFSCRSDTHLSWAAPGPWASTRPLSAAHRGHSGSHQGGRFCGGGPRAGRCDPSLPRTGLHLTAHARAAHVWGDRPTAQSLGSSVTRRTDRPMHIRKLNDSPFHVTGLLFHTGCQKVFVS